MNWVVNGKPEWMLYEFLPLNHYRCFPVVVQMLETLPIEKIQCCTMWCASKNFSLIIISTPFSPRFLPVEPISFFSRLAEAGKPILTDGDLNWRLPIWVASRTQNLLLKCVRTCLNIVGNLLDILNIFLSFPTINRPGKIFVRPARWLVLSGVSVVCNKLWSDG